MQINSNVVKGNFGWSFKPRYRGHEIEIRYQRALDCWHLTVDNNNFKFWTLEEAISKLNSEVK